MSIQDPIANLFSSINNAQARNKEFVKVPSSSKTSVDLFRNLSNKLSLAIRLSL